MTDTNDSRHAGYRNSRVLITGGLGFLGSSLAKKIAPQGAYITLLAKPSHQIPTWINSRSYERINVLADDMTDDAVLSSAVQNSDVIFDFAARTRHSTKSPEPLEDLEANCSAHLRLLECCRITNPTAKMVFASSRLVVGKMTEKPVTETHPTNPTSYYGIHKLATEKYYALYAAAYNMKTTVLRLTNVYGENDASETHSNPVPNLFMKMALQGVSLSIHEGGEQLRDYIDIDDATDALALVGLNDAMSGGLYNLGYGESVKFTDMAEKVISIVGLGVKTFVTRPEGYKINETGDFVADTSKIRKALNWKPTISLDAGLRKMHAFYKTRTNHVS